MNFSDTLHMTEHGSLRYKPPYDNLPTFVPNIYDHKFECRKITIEVYNMIGNWNVITIRLVIARYESKIKYHNHQRLLNMVTDMLQQPSVCLRKFGTNKKHS